MPKTNENWGVLFHEITEAFSVGAPIQERDLFAGRQDQIEALMDAVNQRGRHAVLFGERGVGKTSMANIFPLTIISPTKKVLAVRVNASPDDSFTSLWKKVFKRFSYAAENGQPSRKISDEFLGEITPDDVQLALEEFDETVIPIVILDEFDRIEDKSVTRLVADTIKALSDYSVNITVVIVGVAENVAALIEGHESISRSLIHVKMPRMSQDELGEIIVKRYKRCGISASGDILWKITFLSRGLPYYAHALAMYAARCAINAKTKVVTESLLKVAINVAISDVDQTVREKYLAATISQRGEQSLYERVLLACALASSDELGRFQQSAVASPLNKITGRNYEASTFAFHMNEFTKVNRRQVLERVGEQRAYRYRFTDPMMQPYVVLKGLSDGLLSEEIAEIFEPKRQLRLSIDF